MFRTGNGNRHRVRPHDCMTGYALLEAVLLAAYAFPHGFVALVPEHGHVVTPHELGISNAAVALAPGYDRQRHTFIAALLFHCSLCFARSNPGH